MAQVIRNDSLVSTCIRLSRNVSYRIYSDFFMPDRLGNYQALIERATDAGYTFYSLIDFWEKLQTKEISPEQKCIVLRHDVDSDPPTARRIWELEFRLHVCSSFYFRKSTLDIPLMIDIQESGCEAGYHYEELATLAKKRGVTRREELYALLPKAREQFRNNVARLRESTGLPIRTVASHGDFMNRLLGIPNHVILQDDKLRQDVGIVLEAYDENLMQQLVTRCSDSMHSGLWKYDNPDRAIGRGEKRIHILIHPRQWHADALLNLKSEALRCWEGLNYWRATRCKEC